MLNSPRFLIAGAAIFLAAPVFTSAFAPAFAQSEIGTIERGQYVCELPGDVRGAAGIEQPDQNFEIQSASRYASPQGGGTYLRRGDKVTMTSGPRNGTVYLIAGRGFLRKLDDNGQPSRLRCIRVGR